MCNYRTVKRFVCAAGKGKHGSVRKLNLGFCNVCNELKVHNNGSSDAVKTAAELLLKLA